MIRTVPKIPRKLFILRPGLAEAVWKTRFHVGDGDVWLLRDHETIRVRKEVVDRWKFDVKLEHSGFITFE